MSPHVPRETHRWFVTGTDTGVGKTWITCRLLEHWRNQGRTVAGLKAAESGSGGDDQALVKAAGGHQSERCLYKFDREVAPGVAADDLGTQIDFDLIAAQLQRLQDLDFALVEGAGGWKVPMGGGRTIEDLAQRLGLPVIVVARAGLGTINHSVLTVEAILRSGLSVAAVALSSTPSDDLELATRNRAEIAAMIDVPIVLVRESVAELAGML